MRPASEELDCRPTSVGAWSLRRRPDPTAGDDLFEVKLGETLLGSSSFDDVADRTFSAQSRLLWRACASGDDGHLREPALGPARHETHVSRRGPLSRCPVCRAAALRPFLVVDDKAYDRCDVCAATVLDPKQRLDAAAELAHYRHHENDPADPRYRRFLAGLAEPLCARLAPASFILDYGCGPGPALAAMLGEVGHRVRLFDPFFAPDPGALEARYEAVTCTEVAEHFHNPASEFDRLDSLLKSGGLLALMTCFQTDDTRFSTWHYRRDPTHVVFYKETTLRHIAALRGWTIDIPVKDVAIFQKPA